jgi:TfoX/Sxy family transcriptional regulator of competence genes
LLKAALARLQQLGNVSLRKMLMQKQLMKNEAYPQRSVEF